MNARIASILASVVGYGLCLALLVFGATWIHTQHTAPRDRVMCARLCESEAGPRSLDANTCTCTSGQTFWLDVVRVDQAAARAASR